MIVNQTRNKFGEVKRCSKCGNPILVSAKFCSYCGEKNEVSVEKTAEAHKAETQVASADPATKVVTDVKGQSTVLDLGDKTKTRDIWKQLDLFCKISIIGFSVAFLLLLVAFRKHNGTSVFISSIQVIGFILAIYIRIGKIKVKRQWLNYLIIAVAILFIFPNFNSLTSTDYGSLTSTNNKSDSSWAVDAACKEVKSEVYQSAGEIPTVTGMLIYDNPPQYIVTVQYELSFVKGSHACLVYGYGKDNIGSIRMTKEKNFDFDYFSHLEELKALWKLD